MKGTNIVRSFLTLLAGILVVLGALFGLMKLLQWCGVIR
jgi:hypothetical protein